MHLLCMQLLLAPSDLPGLKHVALRSLVGAGQFYWASSFFPEVTVLTTCCLTSMVINFPGCPIGASALGMVPAMGSELPAMGCKESPPA